MNLCAWPLKLMLSVMALFIGGGDASFGCSNTSSGVLILVGVLGIAEALENRSRLISLASTSEKDSESPPQDQ